MKFYCLLSGCFGLICLQTAAVMAQPISPLQNWVVTPAQQTSPLETVEPVMPVAPFPSPNLDTSPRPLPRQRPIVVIDPGHGGPDPGAVGIGGIYEKEIVLDISLQVASLLENQGVRAILTRQTDVDLGLQPRVEIANRARANLFVSIHANAISMSRPEVNGIETFHIAGSVEGQQLAESIQRHLLTITRMGDRSQPLCTSPTSALDL